MRRYLAYRIRGVCYATMYSYDGGSFMEYELPQSYLGSRCVLMEEL